MMASPAENECASFVMCGSRGRLLLLLLLVVSSNASADAVINGGDSRKLVHVVLVTVHPVVVLIPVLSSRR